MAEKTSIGWCDHTFNPYIGCTKVSPACDNCYAEVWGKRFGVEWGPNAPRRRTSAAYWKQPLRWNRKPDTVRIGKYDAPRPPEGTIMRSEIVIQESKPVWVALTNTDLTEGRGHLFPCAVCDSPTTAMRLGRGRSVQGSDCTVVRAIAVRVNNAWLAPCVIEPETEKDAQARLRMEAAEAAEAKARAHGLTDAEIRALKGTP